MIWRTFGGVTPSDICCAATVPSPVNSKHIPNKNLVSLFIEHKPPRFNLATENAEAAEKGSRMTATDELFEARADRRTVALIRFSELATSCFLVQLQHCRERERLPFKAPCPHAQGRYGLTVVVVAD